MSYSQNNAFGPYNSQNMTFQSTSNQQQFRFCSNYNLYDASNIYQNWCAPVTLSDEDYVRQWSERIKDRQVQKYKDAIKISEAREQLQSLVCLLDELKNHEKLLKDDIDSMSQESWQAISGQITVLKFEIDKILTHMRGPYLNVLRRKLSKRNSKRARIKNKKISTAEQKQQNVIRRNDKSRQIDENLQKSKDELAKIKQEDVMRRQSDIILRDVLRKKHDAKKSLAKLDALVRLRKARLNTAKGRGEKVSLSEADTFEKNIDKLKSMWNEKLQNYEQEESELRAKLKVVTTDVPADKRAEESIAGTIAAWTKAMFGSPSAMPQRDFNGDISEFLAVRTKWDQYINEEGTPIPIGWLLPADNPS